MCVALCYLCSASMVGSFARLVSRRVTRWLEPSADQCWRFLCERRTWRVRAVGEADPHWETRFQLKFECERAIVIELGSSQLRFGLSSWPEPECLSVGFDELAGTLILDDAATDDDARPLPPPPLLQQRIIAEDPSLIEAAARLVASRLGVLPKSLSLLFVVSPVVANEAQLRATQGRLPRVWRCSLDLRPFPNRNETRRSQRAHSLPLNLRCATPRSRQPLV